MPPGVYVQQRAADAGLATSARRPLFDAARAQRALDVAAQVFARCLERIERDVQAGAHTRPHYPGAALVAAALADSGRAPERDLRELVRRAMVVSPQRLGLHGGAAELLVVLDVLDPQRASLREPRARLHELLAGSLRGAAPPDAPAADNDLIGGTAGQAIALGGAVPDALPALRAYAGRYAAALERHVRARDGAWIDLGVSHGLAGMLAALNAALPHERALARRYVDVLLATSHRVDGAHRWGPAWQPERRPDARLAWCYQTLGIAAVLHDRAELDSDGALRALAVDALEAVLSTGERNPAADESLCHGRSGVAAIAWRFARDGDGFERCAAAHASDVLDAFDERLPLGYRSYDMGDGRGADRPDFLDGALGIALFLADAATARERRWLPLLGLLPD